MLQLYQSELVKPFKSGESFQHQDWQRLFRQTKSTREGPCVWTDKRLLPFCM